jgi:hypothetical protein
MTSVEQDNIESGGGDGGGDDFDEDMDDEVINEALEPHDICEIVEHAEKAVEAGEEVEDECEYDTENDSDSESGDDAPKLDEIFAGATQPLLEEFDDDEMIVEDTTSQMQTPDTPDTGHVVAAVSEDPQSSLHPPHNLSAAMPPPPRPSVLSSDVDDSIPIERRFNPHTPNDFVFALGSWAQAESITRRQWEGLLEALRLVTNINQLKNLPPKVDTIKRAAIEALPLLPQRTVEVPLIPEKLPTLPNGQKADIPAGVLPKGKVTFFDPVPYFTTLLSAPSIIDRVHFGMAGLVDCPKEFWHLNSWASSIRAAGNDHAHHNDAPLFPSDFIDFVCGDTPCSCNNGRPHFGRVHSVWRDHWTNSRHRGEVVIRVQRILSSQSHPRLFQHAASRVKKAMMPNELIFMEDSVKEIPERNVRGRREGFRMDSRFDNGIGSARRLDNQPYENGFIRRIFNAKSDTIRSTCQSSPLKGELEIEEFTREFLEEKAPSMWSLPLVCFRDGFGVYRNMYRSLTGVYMSIAGMDQRQRSQRVNNFALTLGPHGSDTEVVLRSIKTIKTLDKGIEVTVKGEKRWLCAHIQVYTGDMTQQNLDAGILAPSATYSCCHCLIPKAKRSDLGFDIIAEGHYHHHMKEYREYYGSTMAPSNFGKMCSKVGLKVGDSALTDITKAIDTTEDFPMDPAHLHFFGLGKRSQMLLITAVFTPAAQKEYVRELQRFPFPPGGTASNLLFTTSNRGRCKSALEAWLSLLCCYVIGLERGI